MSDNDYVEIEMNIWQNVKTLKFVFEDETQGFSEEYDSLEEAKKQLKLYCKEILGVDND